MNILISNDDGVFAPGILAAKQAKAKIVCVPEKNRKDIEELEEEILSGLEICFVEHVTEVFDKAFV